MITALDELELEILGHLRKYGPLNISTLAYDLDLDETYAQEIIMSMGRRKWIEGSRSSGYILSDRFQWIRDIK